MVSATIYT